MEKRAWGDWIFELLSRGMATLVLLLVTGGFITMVVMSLPSIKAFGFSFLVRDIWNPITSEFGALPFIVGTLVTSFLALIITIPFSLGISLFLAVMINALRHIRETKLQKGTCGLQGDRPTGHRVGQTPDPKEGAPVRKLPPQDRPL